MGDPHVKYLLIGGGLASFSAAAAIRMRDEQGSLLLVGQEINRPYNRSPLSKTFLRRQSDRTELFLCRPEWFTDHGVQLRTGCRAANLDTGRSVVNLENGESISYDRLLLATGCAPKPLSIPGRQLPGVFSPHNIEDYEQLQVAVGKAKADGRRRGRAVVIGGGLLGVEIAASIAQAGVEVDLIVAGAHPWSRFAGESAGSFLSRFLSDRGLKLHLGVRAARVEGDGRAQRIILSDGQTIACDFVVAAAGTVPNKDLLRGTGIVAETAILADEHCRTNVAGIYAAGDCAAVRDPVFGKHRAPEQWDTAAATGAVAGANMAGDEVALTGMAAFSTEVFGLRARAWGQAKHVTRRLMRGAANVESADFLEIGLTAEGSVSQILAVGPAGDQAVLAELVRRRVGIAGREELVREPGWGLENLFG